eukprot:scaffold88735_cov28-Tisochrysis_lutea.AAC.8
MGVGQQAVCLCALDRLGDAGAEMVEVRSPLGIAYVSRHPLAPTACIATCTSSPGLVSRRSQA